MIILSKLFHNFLSLVSSRKVWVVVIVWVLLTGTSGAFESNYSNGFINATFSNTSIFLYSNNISITGGVSSDIAPTASLYSTQGSVYNSTDSNPNTDWLSNWDSNANLTLNFSRIRNFYRIVLIQPDSCCNYQTTWFRLNVSNNNVTFTSIFYNSSNSTSSKGIIYDLIKPISSQYIRYIPNIGLHGVGLSTINVYEYNGIKGNVTFHSIDAGINQVISTYNLSVSTPINTSIDISMFDNTTGTPASEQVIVSNQTAINGWINGWIKSLFHSNII